MHVYESRDAALAAKWAVVQSLGRNARDSWLTMETR